MNSGWGDAKKAYTESVGGVNDLYNRSVGSMLNPSPQQGLKDRRNQLMQEIINYTASGYGVDPSRQRAIEQIDRMLAGQNV
jgi:hypothetical protein